MTVEQFINNYKSATDKDKFFSDSIITKYIRYTEKVTDCRNIVNITFEINGDNKYKVDSPAQFVVFVMNLIYRYTNIEKSDNMVNDFESLDELDIINGILDNIPERELSSYNTILNMCKDDYISNNRDLVSFLETKIDAILLTSDTILESIDTILKNTEPVNEK